MIFHYSGYDKNGQYLKSQITANSIEEAKNIISTKGVLIESIKEKRRFFTPKIKNQDLIIICRNLSIYLRSSIPLYQALSLLKNSYENDKNILLWLDSLISSLKSGSTFFEALEEQNIYKLPNFFLYTISASEKSSSLSTTLKELSDFLNTIERIKKEVTKAFIYPSFIILISIIMINFMLVNIVPNIVEIFTSTGSKLPSSTRFTLFISHFFQAYGFYLLIATIIIFSFLGYLLSLRGTFKLYIDKILLKIPLIKNILINYELGRFCSITSLLLKNGIPFALSMNFSSKVFSNLQLQNAFEYISKQIVEGKTLFEATKSQNIVKLPPDFLGAIAIGEDSSELVSTLKTLSEFYEENNRDKISIFLSLIEPILMVVVGGIIGFLVISMLLPIFSISIR